MDLVYDLFMAPLEALKLRQIRKKLLRAVSGRVLEIGTGTGANLPFMPYQYIQSLYLTDLKLSGRVRRYPFPKALQLELMECPIEDLDLPESSMDSIVFTLVFCSVENPQHGLEKIFKLLKPGGRIFFIEHVMPDNHRLRAVVHKINPQWNRIASGCNLNRETLETIRAAGFVIERHSVSLGGALVEGVGVRG